MNLYEQIKNYNPVNDQERNDKEQMLRFMEQNSDYIIVLPYHLVTGVLNLIT